MTDTTTPAPMGATNEAADVEILDTQTPEAPTDALEAPVSDFMNDPNVIAFIQKSVAEGIQKALKGKAPKDTVSPTATEKAEFERMSYRETA